MLDAENPAENQNTENSTGTTVPADTPDTEGTPAKKTAKKAAAKKAPAKKTAAKKTATRKTTTKKVAAATDGAPDAPADSPAEEGAGQGDTPLTGGDQGSVAGQTDAPDAGQTDAPAAKVATKRAAKKTTAKRTTKKTAAASAGTTDAPVTAQAGEAPSDAPSDTLVGDQAEAPSGDPSDTLPGDDDRGGREGTKPAAAGGPPATMLLFKAPEPTAAPARRRKAEPAPATDTAAAEATPDEADAPADSQPRAKRQTTRKRAAAEQKEPAEQTAASAPEPQDHDSDDDADTDESGNRRRRRRGGRRRRKSGENGETGADDSGEHDDQSHDDSARGGSDSESAESGSTSSRRRRRRRRSDDDGDSGGDDPANTVTRVRKPRTASDEITSLSGSTRLEAKKQRRREGREAGRRRAPIVSEAEFLARREAVDRVMVIRQKKDLTQIAVLEDKVLVEHYVARESQTSLIGNVYLGRVQNVLPSMEAAFIDIGKGRNAVLYAGEVNWDSLGAKHGQQRKIESVLKSGQSILVQVSKDPIGHKGARLTSQISLPGRFLVYVPDGTTSGISRKLPDTERNRLKTLLKEIVPDTAGVIVRTAAEGASEEELTRDVERLKARWEDIESKVSGGNAPQLLYGEPDLTLKVVRDLFTEDFAKLVVSGDEAWDMVDDYVKHLAPDLEDRLENYSGNQDVFAAYRIDEQIAKGLDRKVWLPSGGSLVIDRTEAMTVVDVNTGKFTGSGGNLEETVTKNNLEAAEEIVRQLRLRDIGGIIVVDFIDMVLESNRDLVLRRMVECLGRDRTRHQVAEVTSLGLVQMTRKRIGTGLLEAFSETCDHCGGRGLVVHHEPVEQKKRPDEEPRRGRRTGRGRHDEGGDSGGNGPTAPSPKDIAAMAKAEPRVPHTDGVGDETAGQDASRRPAATGTAQPDAAKSDAAKRDAAEPDATEPATAEPARQEPAGQEPAGADSAAPRSSRSSRSRSRRRDQPVLLDDADEGATDVDAGEPAVVDEPVAEEAVPQGEATPATPPRTTTRKRSARRVQGPAGEPTVLSSADLGTDGTGTVAPAATAPEPAPSVAQQERSDGPVAPAQGVGTSMREPEGAGTDTATSQTGGLSAAPISGTSTVSTAPKVVATVRRRGAARRPAGPPTSVGGSTGTTGAGVAPAGAGVDAGAATQPDPGELPVDVEEPAVAAHVPVKKKGSRKR